MPKLKLLGNHALERCDGLELVDMPSVETIGKFAFYDCEEIDTVNAPNVKNIGWGVFNWVFEVKNLIIPEIFDKELMFDWDFDNWDNPFHPFVSYIKEEYRQGAKK